MKYTEHYKIPKPELTDTVNITDLHDIADKFDSLTYDVDTTSKNIKTDEATRVDNEKKRIVSENERIASEKIRVDNELIRTANESTRTTSESKRVLDEAERVKKELERISNETKRVTSESERATNEIERKHNEETRTSNENTRVNNEQYRETTFKRMEELFDQKAPGDMSKVVYDADNDGIIDEAKHSQTSDKATYSDTANESNNAKSVAWDNVQNKPNLVNSINNKKGDVTLTATDIKTSEGITLEDTANKLKDNTVKTITENKDIINISDNVGGIANITLEGNTIDIAKDPIISDFKGKIQGDTSGNPNIAKYTGNKTLLTPPEFKNEFNSSYNKIVSQDNNVEFCLVGDTGTIPQQLFSFNVIAIVENKIGTIQGNNTQEKVAWLKKNVKAITCNWWGYGSCPSGNKAYLKGYCSTGWETSLTQYYNTSNIPSKISFRFSNRDFYTDVNRIDVNGFVHFLAYTDASDGTTTSTVYTDYINIEVQLNPILKSVGERENNKIEVKSIGKNLFNLNENNIAYTQSSTHSFSNGKLTITSTKTSTAAIVGFCIKIKPNTTYTFSAKSTRTGSGGGGVYIAHLSGTKSYVFASAADIPNPNITFSTSYYDKAWIYLYGESGTQTGSSATYWDIQLEEGTAATQYEPYKEDNVLLNLKEPLRGLPNSVQDTINADGTVTRRVGKIVLNGSENWGCVKDSENTRQHFYVQPDNANGKKGAGQLLMCDNFTPVKTGWIYSNFNTVMTSNANCFQIGFTFSKDTYTVDTFKQYLKENPTTVYYELSEPTTEAVGQPLTLQSYTNGILQVDTEVAPFVTIKYPSNLNSRISTVESATSYVKNNLGGAWQTLLILADKELKMKSINKLTTTDALSKKINEIIGVW